MTDKDIDALVYGHYIGTGRVRKVAPPSRRLKYHAGKMPALLDLHKKLDAATLPNDKTQIERQIAATDREIDKLVYELYGLTEEEIAIVEG